MQTTSICAIATPVAPSALGIIRCSGPLSVGVFSDLKPRLATLRKYFSKDKILIDEVVAVYYEHKKSFTGEASLEISCHGNPFILNKILEDLLSRGFTLAQPGEFTRRAFLGGKLDLTQAEAIANLIAANSDRALQVAHRQLAGQLGDAFRKFSQDLIDLIAAVEATIDFPEEDVPVHLPPASKFIVLLNELNALRRTHSAHRLTFHGARVVLIGAPNAGKSSLFNALLGRDRALVSPIAGTTRDYIEAPLTLGGHLIHLIDTAGLNPSAEKNSLESLSIEKSHDQLSTADIILFVFDGTLPCPVFPSSVDVSPALFIANKSDASGFQSQKNSIAVSASSGAGLDDLKSALIEKLNTLMPAADTLMVSSRHNAALGEVMNQVTAAHALLFDKSDPALIAHHLHAALLHLGDILGRFDNERILDSLFGQFCIGK